MSYFALVTGASQGIGKYIAIALAKRSFHLLLVARSEDKLHQLKNELEAAYKIRVEYLSLDLSSVGSAQSLYNWCTQLSVPINILVNNAGFGLWGDFEQLAITEQEKMIHLNITTLTAVTHALLPILTRNPGAYILNISSTAAYQAVPTLAVYAATKAYVLSFSRALRHELQPKQVSVTCICPGPTDTGFADRAGMQVLAELTAKYNMPVETVAEYAVRAMFKKKSEVVPGLTNKIQRFGDWLFPKIVVEKIAAKLYKDKNH